MSGFDTFRRAYSLSLYGVYAVGVLIYMINHIRKRNHIGVVQHGLATLTLESVNFLLLGAIYVLREWTVTARTPDDPLWGRDFTWLNKLSCGMFAGVGWAVSYSRAYVILVKFTRVSTARFALFEVRTARGQIGVLICAGIFVMMMWAVLELGGRNHCLGARLCGQHNALPNSWYLISAPLGMGYAALMGRVVEKAKRAGASSETSGIMLELDICGKFVGSQLMLQNLLIVLADARIIPYNGGFEFYAFNHMMFVIIGLFYTLNIVPTRRQGYGPFDRLNQVWPEDAEDVMIQLDERAETPREGGELIGLGFRRGSAESTSSLSPMNLHLPGTTTPRRSLGGYPSPRPSGEFMHGSRNSSRQSSINSGPKDEGAPGGKPQDDMQLIIQLMRRIEWLAMNKGGADEKARAQVALFLLARAMLNEEAVRCAAHLVRLLQLHGHTKEELEEARSIYLAIIEDHLSAAATLPIDVPHAQQQELLRLLTISSRRRVIFQDDFMNTVRDMYPLLGILAPRVIPVLRIFLLNDAIERRRQSVIPPSAESGLHSGIGGGGV